MNKIRKLAENEVLKIAAGEVIERPANVVKELVENSIDSGASEIVIKIDAAGKDLIEVSDDGCGMTPEDALNSVLPHWTSKINTVDDLCALDSFGFRGEALASINAVSKTSIITRTKDDVACSLQFEFGRLISQQPTSASVGTTIAVAKLFDNIPVRKKFLKQNETEFSQINHFVNCFVLSHQQISFKLFKDGQFFLNAPATQSLENRICQLWGYNLQDELIPFNAEFKDVQLHGLMSNGRAVRYSRSGIFVFVNGRAVRDQKISKAIINAYDKMLAPGQLPVCFLFINVDAHSVDVNIHPRKEEVRFTNLAQLCQQIGQTLRQTLETAITAKITGATILVDYPEEKPENYVVPLSFAPTPTQQPEQSFAEQDFRHSEAESQGARHEIRTAELHETFAPNQVNHHLPATEINFALQQETFVQPESVNTVYRTTDHGKIVGQLMQTFILVEEPDGLIVIDQHAAHERILYEKYKTKLQTLSSCTLVFPELLALEPDAIQFLMQHQKLFEDFALVFDQFSPSQIILRAAPQKIDGTQAAKILSRMFRLASEQNFVDKAALTEFLSEQLYATLACRMAVMANMALDSRTMQRIVVDLASTPNRHQCIHGRPTTWHLPKHKLYGFFKRPVV